MAGLGRAIVKGAELGDSLLDMLTQQGARNVFPAPQRMFDPQDKAFKPFLSEFPPQAGGRYLEMGQGGPKDITGQIVEQGAIGVDPTGKASMKVSEGLLDSLPVNKEGRKTKVNLFKKKAGWKWTQVPEGYPAEPDSNFPIVSIHDGKDHYYALNADFPEGMELARYPNEKSEPRLKPTKKGNVYLGTKVGEIIRNGKKHPVYDRAQIFEMAGTGMAGAGILGQIFGGDEEMY